MAEIPFTNKSDPPVFVIPAEALRDELEELESLRAAVERVRALAGIRINVGDDPSVIWPSEVLAALDGEA